ncbi:MAG: Glu/Leu/Phe/Val dehydrogenase family protein [Lachnospiraceae bacterium]|nr:Glu/Leu/Phe/Val dehydrogenase family protein [Lachnospiraceae bacterium]
MDTRSLYTPLKEEGLTTLIVRYDWKTDKGIMYAAKEWEPDIKWSDYGKTFYTESFLTENDIRLSNRETRDLYEKYGLTEYVDEIFELLRKGRFFGLDCYYNSQKDWRFTANLHSYILGRNNNEHAIYTGGIRRHEKDEPEIDVIVDGLNLGRAQSHKDVAANLPYGGGKITVQAEQVNLEDKDELGFLSYALDKVRFFTGPDMNYPVELADAMAEFTINISAGLRNNPIGPSGGPTAWGIECAMHKAAKFWFGDESLKGLKVAVMGLGAVGFPQACYLIEDGAELIVCDKDPAPVQALKDKYPNIVIEEAGVDEILNVEADILCPCAIGGFITEEVIDNMKFKMVFGAANNQLHATNKEEEIVLAERLADRGILYQECWVQNIGGVMAGTEMHLHREKADRDALMEKIQKICSEKTEVNLRQAKELGITPTENAYRSVENRIYI